MGLFDWIFGASSDRTDAITPQPIHLARGRGYTLELVGESHYQDTLDAMCGGKCEDGHKLPITAQLCFQKDNPHDPHAIVAIFNNKVIGYIPREVAKGMRAEILKLNPHQRPVTCDAKIVGGWHRGEDDEGHYGVKLSLSHPLKLAPSVRNDR